MHNRYPTYMYVLYTSASIHNMHTHMMPYLYSSPLYPMMMGGMTSTHNLHGQNSKLLYTCATYNTHLFSIHSIICTQHMVHAQCICARAHAQFTHECAYAECSGDRVTPTSPKPEPTFLVYRIESFPFSLSQ